jgi:serine/threonine-protein kinase
VNLVEGKTEIITLTLAPSEAPAPPASDTLSVPAAVGAATEVPRVAPAPLPPPEEHAKVSSGGAGRTVGFALGGLGVVGLGVGAYFGVRTLSLVSDSDPYCRHPGGACEDAGIRLRERASDAQTAAIIAASVGSAALAAGAILIFTEKSDQHAVALRVAPSGMTGCVHW